jgi:hypothetical protein
MHFESLWLAVCEIRWWLIVFGIAAIASVISMREGNTSLGRSASRVETLFFFLLDPAAGVFCWWDKRALERRREQARLAQPDLRRAVK